MVNDAYKPKMYVYFVAYGYVFSMVISALFEVPVIVAIGFFMVTVVSIIELRNMYKSSVPYPGLMGKMELWSGRRSTTVFFTILGMLLLLMAVDSLIKELRELLG